MPILIKQTNLKLSIPEQSIIIEKIASLNKFFPKILDLRIEVEKLTGQKTGDIYRAELNISIPNKLIRIEKIAADWRKSVEKVKDHAKRTLSREKKKMVDKTRRPQRVEP